MFAGGDGLAAGGRAGQFSHSYGELQIDEDGDVIYALTLSRSQLTPG